MLRLGRGDWMLNNCNGSEILKDLIRVFVRNLGILEKSDASCCGVTIAQCHTIAAIGRQKKISLVGLADLLGVDKSTMSRMINNLVEAELVLRDLDTEDRRYLIIQLTGKGMDLFKSIEESMDQYYATIFGSIPEDKRDQVLKSLQLLTDAAKNSKCC